MQFFSQDSASFYGKVAYHTWEGMSDDTSERVTELPCAWGGQMMCDGDADVLTLIL